MIALAFGKPSHCPSLLKILLFYIYLYLLLFIFIILHLLFQEFRCQRKICQQLSEFEKFIPVSWAVACHLLLHLISHSLPSSSHHQSELKKSKGGPYSVKNTKTGKEILVAHVLVFTNPTQFSSVSAAIFKSTSQQ